MHFALAGLVVLLLGGCSIADRLNAGADTSNLRIVTDIPYADGSRQTLDVYAPRDATDAPLAIFYYGGGWESGLKKDYAFVAAALANQGIVTIIPDYRVYPEVRFPDFLVDAALAARWARDNAAAYGADPARLVLAGHSAGAHIAAMLALDRQWLRKAGLDARRDVAALVGIAGPYDFLPLQSDTLKIIFGAEDQRPRTQPINFVEPGAPPTLLITGGLDMTVDPRNSERLAARIAAMGGEAKLIRYPLTGHALILGAFAKPLRIFAPTLSDTASFVKATRPREVDQIRSASQVETK